MLDITSRAQRGVLMHTYSLLYTPNRYNVNTRHGKLALMLYTAVHYSEVRDDIHPLKKTGFKSI